MHMYNQAPRPLPPNPVQKVESSPSQASKLSHKPPVVSISSARERRRKNKKEGGRGRVVLKSRSAADLCKMEEKKDSADFATPPERRRCPDSESSRGVDEPDSKSSMGVDEPDSGQITDEKDKSKVEKRGMDSERQREMIDAEFQNQGGVDEPESSPPPDVWKKDSSGLKDNRASCENVTLTNEAVSQQSKAHRGNPRVEGEAEAVEVVYRGTLRVEGEAEAIEVVHRGTLRVEGEVEAIEVVHSSEEVEVEEFFTLLDTTLHLPDSPLSPAPFESEDHPGPPLTAFSTDQREAGEGEGVERRLPPGRLADRIKTLRE